MRWLSALALLSFATFGYAVVGPGVVTGNTAVHDPTMCKDNSGKWFVFCTSTGPILLRLREAYTQLNYKLLRLE